MRAFFFYGEKWREGNEHGSVSTFNKEELMGACPRELSGEYSLGK